MCVCVRACVRVRARACVRVYVHVCLKLFMGIGVRPRVKLIPGVEVLVRGKASPARPGALSGTILPRL